MPTPAPPSKYSGHDGRSRPLTALAAGPARFSELEGAVPGVSRRMMSERLRELEGAGLVRRAVDAGPPITSTYSFTSAAMASAPLGHGPAVGCFPS